MTFHSIPFETVTLRATEARLEAVYEAARKGLRGDRLALAAGMRPQDYRRLREFDPMVELAEEKGMADSELSMSSVLHDAAERGDAQAALAVLKHTHGWVAKQSIDVSVEQRISIIGALERAEQRVLENTSADDAIDAEFTPAVATAAEPAPAEHVSTD